MSLHLSDEAVGGQAEFGDTRVPDVFDQRADFISFGDVVSRTGEKRRAPCYSYRPDLLRPPGTQ